MVVNSLYYDRDDADGTVSMGGLIDDDVILKSLANIYQQANPGQTIDPDLFRAVWDKVNQAADKGYGVPPPASVNFDFYNQLKYNDAVFSAFKVHRAQQDMVSQLLDDKGNLKPFKQWLNDVQPIASHQYGPWLRTEYDTAVLRAHQAADWERFEREKDVFPKLEWMPTTSLHPGADHMIFWGTIRPVDDPFWDEHHPQDRWECKCSLQQTDKEPPGLPDDIKPIDKPQPGLDNNPGKDAKLFSDSHPYISECKGKKDVVQFQCDVLASKVSRQDVRQSFKSYLSSHSSVLHMEDGPVNDIPVTYQGIKSITGKPHKYNYMKNMSCHYLPAIAKEAKYVGCSDDVKSAQAKGHGDALRWHYYEFQLNGESSYLTVKETEKGTFVIHSIQDEDHFDKGKIKSLRK